jgi:hypothetical protein
MTVQVKAQSKRNNKVRVHLYLDDDVIAYYKSQAGHRGYQELINDVLRANISDYSTTSRAERIRALRGKYAYVPTSSDEFALRKQQEIEREG